MLLMIWRIALYIVERYSSMVPLHIGYNGPSPWANHDGIYYLRIAEYGYFHLSEAFFPFYPILISSFRKLFDVPYWIIGTYISLASYSIGVLIFHSYVYGTNKHTALWTVVFLITFPTSFFFCAVYTEGLFFLLSVLVYVFSKRKLWMWAGIFGALASATKLFGALLLFYAAIEYISQKPKKILLRDIVSILCIPMGLIVYMTYLYVAKGDPLYFFHMQPLFGANRTDGIIILPQVVWRYLKILFTAFLQPTPVSYFISIVELIATLFGYCVLWLGWKMKTSWSDLMYSFLVITLPTLTGTLSSMPRYILSAFPLFLILGKLDNRSLQYSIVLLFVILQIILSALFLRGWFVA